LHANNPGIVVPPPPEKQAVGRFDTNFVESRRAALERMLNKTAAHPTLQHDGDLKMFLESESFTVDIKHKERKEPVLAESKGLFSGIGISVGGGGKFVEQDEVGNLTILLIYANTCSGSTSAEYIWTHWKTNLKLF
jgi:sorting nexin-1/2